MAISRRAPSEAQRAERRRRDRDRLQRAARELLTSAGWQRWVRVRSRAGLARLSLSNQLLVALARPDATFVAGFKTWLQLGYAVKNGEKPIRIIAPLPVKEHHRTTREETGETRVFFKTVFVFDRAQVAPIEGAEHAPLEPPCQPLTGDTHSHLIAPLHAFAESLGFTVSLEGIDGAAGGWCDRIARRIVIDATAPANARLRTLIHETIHALGVGYSEYGRQRAEVIADTATYVVCSSVGLDLAGESVPYVAGWGEDGALDAETTLRRAIGRGELEAWQPNSDGKLVIWRSAVIEWATRRPATACGEPAARSDRGSTKSGSRPRRGRGASTLPDRIRLSDLG